jgi:hypothetical protein
MNWGEQCGICGNLLIWWRSKSGYRVCMRCHPQALSALACLGRRVPGGAALVERWIACDGKGRPTMQKCLGCGKPVDPEDLDVWCHTCLDLLCQKLASQLMNTQWGMAHGPSLMAVFRSDRRWWDRPR